MNDDEEREERDIIMNLESYVVLEYIKSSVDIILNLKFEEIEKKLINKNNGASNPKKRGTCSILPKYNFIKLIGSQNNNNNNNDMKDSETLGSPCNPENSSSRSTFSC
jgi:hypothetical protein